MVHQVSHVVAAAVYRWHTLRLSAYVSGVKRFQVKIKSFFYYHT